jgi:hypothetical protein
MTALAFGGDEGVIFRVIATASVRSLGLAVRFAIQLGY